MRKTVLTVDAKVGVGAVVAAGLGIDVAVPTGGTTGVGAPVVGVVLQEARKMLITVARTIQR